MTKNIFYYFNTLAMRLKLAINFIFSLLVFNYVSPSLLAIELQALVYCGPRKNMRFLSNNPSVKYSASSISPVITYSSPDKDKKFIYDDNKGRSGIYL